jgi:hypothetical protein
MNALLWFFVIVMGISLVFRLMGPLMLKMLVRWLNKKAQQDLDRQTRDFEEKAENNSPFVDKYTFGKDMKVIVPKHQPPTDKNKMPHQAEDVDYEDLS